MSGEPDARPPAVERGCANCGARLFGPWCAQCGQEDRPLDEPFRSVIRHYAASLIDWDGRLWKTLRVLLLRPGVLTREYNAGRRARYAPPVRIFLIAGFLMLIGVALGGDLVTVSIGTPLEPDVATPGQALSGTPLAALGERFDRGLARAHSDPARLRELWFRNFLWSMFAAIPLFALLVALLEHSARRPYVHHLVFAVHFHAVAFFVLALLFAGSKLLVAAMVLLGGAVSLLLLASVALYLAAAVRGAYGRGWLRSLASALLLGMLHIPVVVLLAIGATVVTVLLIG